MDDPTTREAILSLLARLEQAWQQLDFAAIRRLWDTSRPPVYQAEEALKPSLDWEQLQAYWDLTERVIERMGMRITSPVTLHELGPDLVTAVYEMHWDALLRSESSAVGGDNRVYATFRRTEAGWRFAQYVESPLAPIVYMRRLYENSVSADFPRTR